MEKVIAFAHLPGLHALLPARDLRDLARAEVRDQRVERERREVQRMQLLAQRRRVRGARAPLQQPLERVLGEQVPSLASLFPLKAGKWS